MIPLGQMPIAVSGYQKPAGADASQIMQVTSSVFNSASLYIRGTTVNGVKRIDVDRTRYPDIVETCLGPPGGSAEGTYNQLWFVNGCPWVQGTPAPPPGTPNSFGPLYIRAVGINGPNFASSGITNNTWTNATGTGFIPAIDIGYYADGVNSQQIYLDLTYDPTGAVYERHAILFANYA